MNILKKSFLVGSIALMAANPCVCSENEMTIKELGQLVYLTNTNVSEFNKNLSSLIKKSEGWEIESEEWRNIFERLPAQMTGTANVITKNALKDYKKTVDYTEKRAKKLVDYTSKKGLDTIQEIRGGIKELHETLKSCGLIIDKIYQLPANSDVDNIVKSIRGATQDIKEAAQDVNQSSQNFEKTIDKLENSGKNLIWIATGAGTFLIFAGTVIICIVPKLINKFCDV